MVQILRGADCGQDLGDATGDVEARLRVERKKELRLGPRGVRHTDWKGEKGKRERENLDKSEIRSESWKLLAKQRKASERVL